jgi:hypothetical protein
LPSCRFSRRPPPEIQTSCRGSKALLPAGVRHYPLAVTPVKAAALMGFRPSRAFSLLSGAPLGATLMPLWRRQPKSTATPGLHGFARLEDRVGLSQDSLLFWGF